MASSSSAPGTLPADSLLAVVFTTMYVDNPAGQRHVRAHYDSTAQVAVAACRARCRARPTSCSAWGATVTGRFTAGGIYAPEEQSTWSDFKSLVAGR